MTASKINPSLYSKDKNPNKIKQENTSMEAMTASEYTGFKARVAKSDELDTKILPSGDLSNDIKALKLDERTVRLNNSGSYLNISTIDKTEDINILESYSSSLKNNFELNGKISDKGKLIYIGFFSWLILEIKELLEKIGIKFSTNEEILVCRHISTAFITGLITLDDLNGIKDKQEFINLLESIREQNKHIENTNKTVFQLLEDEFYEIDFSFQNPIREYLIPPNLPEYTCLAKIAESLSLLEPQITKFYNDSEANLLLEHVNTIKKKIAIIKSKVLNIKHSVGKNRKDLIDIYKSDIKKIENAVRILIVYHLIPDDINNSAIEKIQQQLQTLEKLRIEKNSDLTTEKPTDQAVCNLQHLADYFDSNNKKQVAKKIRSIVKDESFESISKKKLDSLWSIIIEHFSLVNDFLIEHNLDFFSSALLPDGGEFIPTSEDNLADTLYSMCNAIIDSPDKNTAIFSMLTFNHLMMLEITYKNNNIYIKFYDPNDTTIYKTIALTSVEYVKQLSIKNFISDDKRVNYKIASKADIKNDSLSTKHGHIIFSRKKQTA
jgi:hypothetical protein